MRRRVAVLRLTLADGRCLARQLVETDDEGKMLQHEHLTEERPMTQWWPGEAHIDGDDHLILDKE
jgi:hypothetical protein